MKRIPWNLICLAVLIAYPFVPGIASVRGIPLGPKIGDIFIYAILALGLNVVVGQAGLFQLGIAAFFAIGAYITGILTVSELPFQIGFWWALAASTVGAAVAGVLLAAPTLRLRGDYLAIVTLGFAEVLKYTLINIESITNGPRGLNPVPPPSLAWIRMAPAWDTDYRGFYFLVLGLLVLVVWILRNMERSRLGRALTAIREDELAAQCMGVKTTPVKLIAFAIGAGLAGMAGCLCATRLQNTGAPTSYDFSVSIIVICFLIIGGLGNVYGAILGAFVIRGFDVILSPILDQVVQHRFPGTQSVFLTFTNWRLLFFGMALILMMRFRPEGILPAEGMREELHEKAGA